jgi:hypothetical protein
LKDEDAVGARVLHLYPENMAAGGIDPCVTLT